MSDTLTLAGEGLRIDVEVFEGTAAEAEHSPSIDRHRAAVDLYRGDLLPEDRFDAWAIGRREALRDRHLNLLVDLAGKCVRRPAIVRRLLTCSRGRCSTSRCTSGRIEG